MKVFPATAVAGSRKKLRRLPNFFSKMLELPLGVDADVHVKEEKTVFRFFAPAGGVRRGVRAHAFVVHPGVMKVVILGDDYLVAERGLAEEFELDRWRFRLPPSTLPALATAECVDGQLVVTVPKRDGWEEREEDFTAEDGAISGSSAMIQLVSLL